MLAAGFCQSDKPQRVWRDEGAFMQALVKPPWYQQAGWYPPGLQEIRGLLGLQVPQAFLSSLLTPELLASLHSGHGAWSLLSIPQTFVPLDQSPHHHRWATGDLSRGGQGC